MNIGTFCKIVTYPKHHLLHFLLFISLECFISYMFLEWSCFVQILHKMCI